MRTDLTNNQLLALHNDVQHQCNTSPAFYYFSKEKIKRFYQQNGMQVKLIETKMQGFISKYVLHETCGAPGVADKPITAEKDGKQVYTFLTPELEKEYLDKVEEFMTRTVKIEL